jgi:hypothetical protein
LNPRCVDCLGFFFMASDALICFSHKECCRLWPSATKSQGSDARQLALSCDAVVLFRRAHGRRDLPVALRAEKRAVQARGLSKPPTRANDFFREETDDPLVADRRNFFKVELWTKDSRHVERLLFAGNNLDKARALFDAYAKKRPRARLTIRQRSRVVAEWPP